MIVVKPWLPSRINWWCHHNHLATDNERLFTNICAGHHNWFLMCIIMVRCNTNRHSLRGDSRFKRRLLSTHRATFINHPKHFPTLQPHTYSASRIRLTWQCLIPEWAQCTRSVPSFSFLRRWQWICEIVQWSLLLFTFYLDHHHYYLLSSLFNCNWPYQRRVDRLTLLQYPNQADWLQMISLPRLICNFASNLSCDLNTIHYSPTCWSAEMGSVSTAINATANRSSGRTTDLGCRVEQ